MTHFERSFIPAAGKDWLLPFYDLFTKLLGAEAAHRRLLDQAAIHPRQRLLEIGCGTGNLVILAKRLNPSVDAVGVDPDPKALSRARKKAHQAAITVEFEQAYAEQLPFPDASFDIVLSAFMLHHIQPDLRLAAMREAYRVLKPGGALQLVDFQPGEHQHGGHHGVPHLHTRSRLQSGVPQLLQEVGFAGAKLVTNQTIVIGKIAYYSAIRPQDVPSSFRDAHQSIER